MGGEGSGRKPDLIKQIFNKVEEQKTAIANLQGDSLYLPNYSGLSDSTKKTTDLSRQSQQKGAITFLSNAILDGEYDAKWKFENPAGQAVVMIKADAVGAKLEFHNDFNVADQKAWQIYVNDSGEFRFGALADSYAGQNIAMSFGRSGTTLTDCYIYSPTVYLEEGIISSMLSAGTITIGDWNGNYNGDVITVDATGNYINFATGQIAVNGSPGIDGATVVTSAGVRSIVHGIIMA